MRKHKIKKISITNTKKRVYTIDTIPSVFVRVVLLLYLFKYALQHAFISIVRRDTAQSPSLFTEPIFCWSGRSMFVYTSLFSYLRRRVEGVVEQYVCVHASVGLRDIYIHSPRSRYKTGRELRTRVANV